MQQESLLIPVGRTQAVTSMQTAKSQVRRVMHNKDRSLDRTHPAHCRLHVRLQHVARLDLAVCKEPVETLELAIVVDHARESNVWSLHRALRNSLQARCTTSISQLRRGKLARDRIPRAIS